MIKNRVKGEKFTYHETVKDFVGLVFHCPECEQELHLHIAAVYLEKEKKG